MRRFTLPAVVSILALALVGLLVFGVLSTAESTSIDQALAQGGRPRAHDARLPLLDGAGTTSLARYRGGYLVVNFFASWCEGCKTEAALLDDVQRTLRRRGGTVLGVSWNDAVQDARGFVRAQHVTFPVARDVDGSFARAYGVAGLPETFVIDPRGRIVALRRNQLTRQWLRDTFDPLVASGERGQ